MSRHSAALLVLVACACQQPTTSNRFAVLEVVDAQGNARTSLDFGRVPIAVAAQHHVLIRNSGTAGLTVTGATFSDRVFGTQSAFPIGVDAGATGELVLRFTPSVVEQRVTGTVTLASNDAPFELGLSGTGIAAPLVATPSTLDFAEVYLGESKTLSVLLLNVSSAPVVIASVDGGVNISVTNALTTLAPGDQTVAKVTFTPTVMGEVVSGPLAVGPSLVPMQGRAIAALPRACVRFGVGEQCSDGGTLTVDFGVGLRTGTLSFRNDGNTPVSYTVQYQVPACASVLAFSFSNAPGDGGVTQWTEATTALPMNVTDSRPWETAPISITAHACGTPTPAVVLWQRQDATHAPSSLTVTLIAH